MVGHNHSLPNSPIAVPVVAVVAVVPQNDALSEIGFAGPAAKLLTFSSSPPLLSPLRI
jgi:hypothetical protein